MTNVVDIDVRIAKHNPWNTEIDEDIFTIEENKLTRLFLYVFGLVLTTVSYWIVSTHIGVNCAIDCMVYQIGN